MKAKLVSRGNLQSRYLFTCGAALVLMLLILAGCGGQTGPISPLPTVSAGVQSVATPTVAATTAAAPIGDAGASNSATPTTLAASTAGSSGNTSSGPGIDLATFHVCSVLTQDEIVSLMPNLEYDGTDSGFDPGSGTRTCTYSQNVRTGYLQLTLYTPNRWEDEAKHIGVGSEPVSGLGDEAVTVALRDAQVLSVLVKGKAAFEIAVNPGSNADGGYDAKAARELAIQLATKIISRLR